MVRNRAGRSTSIGRPTTASREWPKSDIHESLGGALRILIKDKDERVRAMAAVLLGDAEHPSSVPPLIEALGDPSPYSFRLIHRALNKLTYAFIETIEPEELDETARKRIAAAWRAWFDANRDRYRQPPTPTANR